MKMQSNDTLMEGNTSKTIVRGWMSSEKEPGDGSWYAAPKPVDHMLESITLYASEPDDSAIMTIQADPSKTFQTILGMGTSLEESTVYNLCRMSAEKRHEVLVKLFDSRDGIGMSLVRLTIGTADFTSRKFYTYDDLPAGQTDPELKHFSIQKDIDYHITDVAKEILSINPDIKFFSSPWSPPGWMKTFNSDFAEDNEYNLRGGKLKSEWIPVLAQYYRRYVEEYARMGIPIYALTLQNEPLLEIDYPSCHVTPEQEKLLSIALKKEFEENRQDTKIWVFDHNMDDAMSYVSELLNNPEAFDAVEGIAFHDYSGDPSVMTDMHNAYTGKNVMLTERSWWGAWGMDRIAQYFRNWSVSYNAWVTMLDSNIATHQWVGTPGPTMLIQNAEKTDPTASYHDDYWLCPEYYLIGQFTKFIMPGVVRVESNYGSPESVTNVAFKNPDGNIVVVVINQNKSEQAFKILCRDVQINAVIPAGTVASYTWSLT